MNPYLGQTPQTGASGFLHPAAEMLLQFGFVISMAFLFSFLVERRLDRRIWDLESKMRGVEKKLGNLQWDD